MQETFIGFLTSLPNYDPAAAAGELAVHDRQPQADRLPAPRRSPAGDPAVVAPTAPAATGSLPGGGRPASSIARSGERRALEDEALARGIAEQLDDWRHEGRLAEGEVHGAVVRVRRWRTRKSPRSLGITEQQVANFKFDFLDRLRKFVKQQRLNEDVFPELYANE